jgi:alkylation response protein AidB-like acyl-CoA dehydrogenase
VRLTDPQRELMMRARQLARDVIAPRAAEVDRSEDYPWDNVAALRDAGFMGMTVPEAYGGFGLGYLEACLVIEEMAKVCGVSARIVVEANMGAIGAILAYGTEAQKRLAADCVLSGDKPAICITEPQAGSAASEMTTRADRKGGGYVINGRKHWITGGGVSRLHLVFARVFEDGAEQGIGGFIVLRDPEAGTPEGLVIGAREPAMGLRGIPETEVLFQDLEVPAEMLLRPADGLRRGFAHLMSAYNAQRIGAATVALGIAQGAYEKALDYAKRREQFGRPIAEFQGLQWMLADMSIQIAGARALIHEAVSEAAAAANGHDYAAAFPEVTKAAQAKVFASEMAIKVTNDALQVFGAAGYSRNNELERMLRDARMFTIGGGTAQVLRNVIAGRILERKLPQTRDGYLNLARDR